RALHKHTGRWIPRVHLWLGHLSICALRDPLSAQRREAPLLAPSESHGGRWILSELHASLRLHLHGR
ncbi:Translocation protein SEC62, partial [Caligus rogercresseyi]